MEQLLFDEMPSDDFIQSTVKLCGTDGWEVSEMFSKEHSKDFYLGMIAANRVALSFLNRFSGDDLMIAIMKLNMYCSIIANEK